MILDEIVAHKCREIEERKRKALLSSLEARLNRASTVRPFARELSVQGRVRIIAELKKASPSGGLLCPDFRPEAIAQEYQKGGAAALSVLTDEKYFQGRLEYLEEAKRATNLPALRKDFIIDPYQIVEARAGGADCILLIVRILKREELAEFLRLARELGMDALIETHTEEEVSAALAAGATLIGINNRDLDTLSTSLETTGRLRKRIPDGPVVVSESGIKSAEDIRRLRDWGVHAALVGESLMRSPNRAAALAELTQA